MAHKGSVAGILTLVRFIVNYNFTDLVQVDDHPAAILLSEGCAECALSHWFLTVAESASISASDRSSFTVYFDVGRHIGSGNAFECPKAGSKTLPLVLGHRGPDYCPNRIDVFLSESSRQRREELLDL